MLIHVTQKHIEESLSILGHPGTFNDKFFDPVTLAIKSSIKAKRILTHPFCVEIDGKWYPLPKEVFQWVNNWCRGDVVNPFSFNFDYVE